MQEIFKRDFIYGSMVHATPSDPATLGDGSLLTVKTCSCATSRSSDRLKEGFSIVFTSLPQHEVLAGKASGKHVDELCPFRGWLLVERAPESKASVRVLFHAGLDPEFVDANKSVSLGLCSAKTTAARLLRLAKRNLPAW
ncbi:hypothetical protein ON010_g12752 [Phytophthora cinnamomi]|nr:hypothetical protein ON010_g12752 [Phytophthora cinnamomi]